MERCRAATRRRTSRTLIPKQAVSARSLKADYRFALTGTPVENNVGDLWSIIEFLNPSFLGTQGQFKRNFFVPIQAEHDPDATDRLRHATGPFILRRLKTDKSVISDLPEKNGDEGLLPSHRGGRQSMYILGAQGC